MNSEAEKTVLRRQKELKDLGVYEQRRHALQTLKLKTVIKESHCTPVAALAFNSVDEECANIFATVGKDQATIYDDLHMGDSIGVVVQYVNTETQHSQGGVAKKVTGKFPTIDECGTAHLQELRTCAWLNSQQWCRHPQGDACLAVAGLDTNISIISIVESRVTLQLRGHKKEVVDLAACTRVPNLLASLSKDGELRLWDAPNETCTACISTEATSLALSPDGRRLATGSRKGGLRLWSVPQTLSADTVAAQKTQKKKTKQTVLGEMESQVLKLDGSASHLESVDCLQFLDDTRLISKSADGRIIVTDLTNSQQLASWKVPNCSPGGGLEERCRFSTTKDGSVVCTGNSKGEVYVYETASGNKLAHVAPIKVVAPVRACGLSEDCRHLLGAMGNGFIFRFEAVPEETGAAANQGSSGEEAAAMEE